MSNIDKTVVEDFGNEWTAFNQSDLSDAELAQAFDQYFDIFPFDSLAPDAAGFDMGCGSGRWAKFVAARVGTLNCIDPSPMAIEVARRTLSDRSNVHFFVASVDGGALQPESQDFGYCLGVLHHTPNTADGIRSCAKLLKRGAPFLIYLYYNFENRPLWFRAIWKMSDLVRRAICILPFGIKKLATNALALVIYLPLARFAALWERFGKNVANFPLADYRRKPFYFMRNDALDRFGTRLEQRFSRDEIQTMLTAAGFDQIEFSNRTPFWVACARKA